MIYKFLPCKCQYTLLSITCRNFGLLSFGEEAEEDEGEALEYRGKPKSSHDLLDDPKFSRKTAAGKEICVD
jgi:hypothetical protein